MAEAFAPVAASTVNIDVAATTASVAVPIGSSRQVRVMNNGTATVWITWGLTGVTSTLATGLPVGPGVTEVLTVPDLGGPAYVAAIAAGATGKIYFTPGRGV
jgi:hypothetical protein